MKLMKLFLACAIAFLASDIPAQVATNVPDPVPGAKPATVEHIKIHGTALEGNLEGDAVDRDAIVFLPPSYEKDKKRRYPVVYALHGYSIGAEQWTKEIHVPQTIEGAFAQGAKEMIVVLPDSKTIYNGSMYSSSATTGDFENYIARDVVGYMDAHYRTIPNRTSRGLVGHSMGGYGASRIGMKHPDVFGALYIMSPVLHVSHGRWRTRPRRSDEGAGDRRARKKLPQPSLPPTWLHSRPALPLPSMQRRQHGRPIPRTLRFISTCRPRTAFRSRRSMAKYAANSPLAFVDQYIGNLKQYRAIAMDVGDQDGLRFDTTKLHDILDNYGIANSFEVYSGTHTSAVADRFQNHVMPFFSKNLCFTAVCR